jgi:superfamily II DNA or RNA helicase
VFTMGSTEHIARLLKSNGINAIAMTSDMNAIKRGKMLDMFEKGLIQVLCVKYSVYSAGVDLKTAHTLILIEPPILVNWYK